MRQREPQMIQTNAPGNDKFMHIMMIYLSPFHPFSQTALLLGSWIPPVAMNHPQTKESERESHPATLKKGFMLSITVIHSGVCLLCFVVAAGGVFMLFFSPLPPLQARFQINLYNINHLAKQICSASIGFSQSQGINWIVIRWLFINECSICHYV